MVLNLGILTQSLLFDKTIDNIILPNFLVLKPKSVRLSKSLKLLLDDCGEQRA